MGLGGVDLSQLRRFEDVVRAEIPGFRIAFKNETWHQKALGLILRPFNPKYMESYTTTLSPVVYFPSREFYEGDPASSFAILAHEYVHLVDTKRHPVWFRLSYLLPQLLAPVFWLVFTALTGFNVWAVSLLAVAATVGGFVAKLSRTVEFLLAIGAILGTMVYAVVAYGWMTLLLFAGVIALAPLPAMWRVQWELRGYTVQLALYQWADGAVPEEYREWVRSIFNGAGYYFMSWDAGHIRRCINDIVDSAASGRLQTEHPYDTIYRFAEAEGFFRKPSG
jgi:hypothetical protein